jgi:hypothetical protein
MHNVNFSFYSEYGLTPTECRDYALANFPEIFGEEELTRKLAEANLDEDEVNICSQLI